MKIRIMCVLAAFLIAVNTVPSAALALGADAGQFDVDETVKAMSLKDKITQMMMVDFRKWGSTAEDAKSFTEMNDEVYKLVEEYNFGAVILFSDNLKNTEQTFYLTKALQDAATAGGGIPLMITADQEGGIVTRLGTGTSLPGNMALGATYAINGTKYAMEAGRIIGSELSALGINTNLSPVVDVNGNANNPVIGLRSFSDDPDIVGELASAVIRGMAEYGVIGTAKHFPGHGDTETDSHYGLPAVDKTRDELNENELKPYFIAISEGIEMIMTAHILYPELEKDKILSAKTGEYESLPATLSDDILTGLLKGEMGFGGVVVTDAMNMAGITDKWDPVQAAIISVQAGADMLCMPTRLYCADDVAALDSIIEGLVNAVEAGEIPESRIDDAVTRILNVKKARGILDREGDEADPEHAKAVVGCEENRKAEREMAAAAITLVKNESDTLPLKLTKDSSVLMLVAYDDESASMVMGWNRAREAGLIPDGANVKVYRYSEGSVVEGAFTPELQSALDGADTLLILSEGGSASYMEYQRWASAIPNELCDYARENGKRSVIISAEKPYDVQLYPNSDAILAAYGWKGSSVDPTEALTGGITDSEAAYGPNIIAAVEVAFGVFSPEGRLPVDIPAYDAESGGFSSELAFERGYGLSYSAPDTRDSAASVIAAVTATASLFFILALFIKRKKGMN